MTVQTLIQEVERFGLRLEPRGDKLVIRPASRCPLHLKERLRQHKSEVLQALRSMPSAITGLISPCVHTAEQVLAGEFEGGSLAVLEAVEITLGGSSHPICENAMRKLRKEIRKAGRK